HATWCSLSWRRYRLDLIGREEEMAGLPGHAQSPARVLLQCDGEMDPVLIILLNGLSNGDFAGQRQVEDVASGARTESDLAAPGDRCAMYGHALWGWPLQYLPGWGTPYTAVRSSLYAALMVLAAARVALVVQRRRAPARTGCDRW